MFLVERAHGRARRRNHVVHEEEQSILWPQMDSLADEEVELANGQIRGHEVFLLIQISDARLWCLLHDHGNAIGILLADLLAFGSALLERMLFLVLELHRYAVDADQQVAITQRER